MTLKPPIVIHIYWYSIVEYTITGHFVIECVLWRTSTWGLNTINQRRCRWALCTTMMLFNNSGSYISSHLWRNYWCIPSCTSFCSDQIKSHQKFTFLMRKVGCLVNMAALFVGFLRGSVLKVDLAGAVKKKGNFRFFIASNSWRVSFFPGTCTL